MVRYVVLKLVGSAWTLLGVYWDLDQALERYREECSKLDSPILTPVVVAAVLRDSVSEEACRAVCGGEGVCVESCIRRYGESAEAHHDEIFHSRCVP